ncbi:hypothetical protein NC651_007146 [Populus alba x Populus x berolinensis]|nr:hypothetical protein NC651_007146 [Populus alba x Populus x berolinensis]
MSHDLVTFLKGYLAMHESVSGLEALPSPRLFSTHCPYTFVYVCRDPRDVISTWHFVNRSTIYCQNHNLWKMCSRFFVKEFQPMDPFGTRCCQRKLILFLKYEDLKRDPSVHSKRDEERDGVVLGIMKLCSFENLSNLEINKSSSPQFSFKNSDFFTKGKTPIGKITSQQRRPQL